ncbi:MULTISPECIES: DUF6257 family protein [unclassified Streptomyces]|uniref:DUF6257 family protein n=1 Tax=unclassified Streptomyces TaxID=2593676 RepID=UPI00382FFEC3
MAKDVGFSDFTTGEKARIGLLLARMGKRGLADNGSGNVYVADLMARIERIEDTARKRKNGK